jgi:Sigma-70, region 4
MACTTLRSPVATIDALPADQRAVLQLLLAQGKSYEDLARMLRLDREAVRARAHAAMSSLGPHGGVPPDAQRQAAIADYLLGQQAVSERAATRARLESSATDRAWARVVASELRPIAGDNLPEIPAEGAEVDEAFDALQARTQAREHARRSSRLGGVLLLAGLGVVLAVVLILVLSGGDDNSGAGSTSGTTPTTTDSTASQVLAQVNLRSPSGRGDALGAAQIVRRGGTLGVIMQGQGLPKCGRKFAYGVWLYNSPTDARILGFVNSDKPSFDTCLTTGNKLVAISGLPANASHYRHLIVTRETGSSQPTRPGTIVLRGDMTLNS